MKSRDDAVLLASDKQSQFAVGDKVRILNDSDGAAGEVAIIGKVYKSGRCRVDLPKGCFRNLPPHCLELVE